ncbi:MAG: AEC family transporter [Bacteroidota bacterium]
MDNIVFILALLLIGIAIKRLPAFPDDSAQILTSFVIYISLPALILVKIPELEVSADILVPALLPWVMVIFSAIIVLVFSKIFKWSRQITGALLLLVPLGNTSFFGIPMVESFFGSDHISYALLYDQLGTFLALATYGTIIIAIYSDKEDIVNESVKEQIKVIAKKVFTFPPLLALITAFIIASWPIPTELNFIFESLAATLVPLVIIAVGLKIEFTIKREEINPMAIGLGIKLVLAPVFALMLIKALGIDSAASKVAVFEAGMPPQISAWALAMLAGLAPKLGAMMVAMGIIVSFFTLSVLYQFL